MKHKIVSSRKSGQDSWRIKCSCGWRTSGWRWLCEERFVEHSTPEPIEQPQCVLGSNEFPNGEFKDEYYAKQGDLRYIV